MRKLMLKDDLPDLGKVGDVVEVNDGYARNYLIPQHLAVEPTPANIKKVEEVKKVIEAKRARLIEEKKNEASRLDGQEVTLVVNANEQGHLFGSVGPKEIADALKEEGYNINPKIILLPEHIKMVDKYEVPLEFAPGITCTIKVWVAPTKQLDQSQEETETDDSDE